MSRSCSWPRFPPARGRPTVTCVAAADREECLIIDPGFEAGPGLARRADRAPPEAGGGGPHPRSSRPLLLGDAGVRVLRLELLDPRPGPGPADRPLAGDGAGEQGDGGAADGGTGQFHRARRRARAGRRGHGWIWPDWRWTSCTHPGTRPGRSCTAAYPDDDVDSGRVLRRRAVRRFDRPNRPARRKSCRHADESARRRCCRSRTRRWCCPGTVRRPRWPGSGRTTRTCSRRRSGSCGSPTSSSQPARSAPAESVRQGEQWATPVCTMRLCPAVRNLRSRRCRRTCGRSGAQARSSAARSLRSSRRALIFFSASSFSSLSF